MTYISHISFSTGENKNSLKDLSCELDSTRDIELLFGGQFPSELSYCHASSYQTLLQTCLDTVPKFFMKKIDTVVFFSSNFLTEFHIHNDILGSSMLAVQLAPSRTINISGGGCVSSIHAAEYADMLIRLEQSDCCLIIGIEHQKGLQRLHDYAVLSDACVAIIAEPTNSSAKGLYKIDCIKTASSIENMNLTPSLSAPNLSKRILKDLGIIPNQITTLCSNNLFFPVKKFKEKLLGFKDHQQQISDHFLNSGHFLSCDPWINLLKAEDKSKSGDKLLLLTEAAGHAGGLICRKL